MKYSRRILLLLFALVVVLEPALAQTRGIRLIEAGEESARTPGTECEPRGIGLDIVRTSGAEYFCDDSSGPTSATWVVREPGAASAAGDSGDVQVNIGDVLNTVDGFEISTVTGNLSVKALVGRENVSAYATGGDGTSGDPWVGWESVCDEAAGFHFNGRVGARGFYSTSTGCQVQIADNGDPNTNDHGTIISGDGQDRVTITVTADLPALHIEGTGSPLITINSFYMPGGFTLTTSVAHTTNPILLIENLDSHFVLEGVKVVGGNQNVVTGMHVLNSQNGVIIGPEVTGYGPSAVNQGVCLLMSVDDAIQRGNISILGGMLQYCKDGIRLTTGGTGIFNNLQFYGTKVLHSASNTVDGTVGIDIESNVDMVRLSGVQIERFETCVDADGVNGLQIDGSLLSLCRTVADDAGAAVNLVNDSQGTEISSTWISDPYNGIVIGAAAIQAVEYSRARIDDVVTCAVDSSIGCEIVNNSTAADAVLAKDGGDVLQYATTYDVDKAGNADTLEIDKQNGSGTQEWRAVLQSQTAGPRVMMYDAADASLNDWFSFDVSNDWTNVPRLRVGGSAEGSAIELGVLGDGTFRNGSVNIIRDDVSGDYQMAEFDKLTSTVRDWRIRVLGSDTLFKIDAYNASNLFVAPVLRWNASSEWSEMDKLRLGGNVDGSAITFGVTGDTTLRGDVSQVENLTVKEDVTVGSDTTTSSGELLLHGFLGTPAIPPNNRGGAIGFASSGSTIGCYQESNAQGVLVWDTSRLTHGTTDLGNASLSCSTGRATLGDELKLIGADPTIVFDGSTILYQIVANETIGWDGFMFTAGLGFGTAPPTEGFFGKVNALDASEPNVESWKTDSAIVDDEEVTAFVFRGTDSLTNSVSDYGAAIRAIADADWGDAADNNDMPTRLEIRVQNDGASDGLAAAHTTFHSDGDAELVDGDLVVTANDKMLVGGRSVMLCTGKNFSPTAAGTYYMNDQGSTAMSSTVGQPMPRAGSMIAMSYRANEFGNSSDTIDYQCRINGTVKLSVQTTPPTGPNVVTGQTTAAPGAHPFVAGDQIQTSVLLSGSSGIPQSPLICCEVVYNN